jgi:type I restriction enzyme S subunit
MSWKTFSIGDIAEVVTKGTTPTTYGMPFTDDGVNFIKAEALNGDVSLDRSGFTFISEDTHEKLKRSQLEPNDVLITIAGANVGKCGIVREEDLPANTNQAVGIIRVKPKLANPRFVYYHFKNPSVFSICQNFGGQAAQPNINLSILKNVKIKIPSLDFQKRIIGYISSYEDLIRNNRRRIQLLEESARLLYKEWFFHLRFPGHEHVKIVDGVPEGWIKTNAYDVMDVLSGGTPKTGVADYWDGDIPFFTPRDTTNSPFTFHTEKTITERALQSCNSRLYPKYTLFITARGTVGKLSFAQRPMAMNQSCYALVGKGLLNQIFLYCALNSSIEQFKARASGSVFDAIVVDTFKQIPFIKPTDKLLISFNEEASKIFQQIDNLTMMNLKLAEARDLLLPRLMNGELTL